MLADTDTRKLPATGLQLAALRDALDEAAPQLRIFYILDCCFSGNPRRGGLAAGTTFGQRAADSLTPVARNGTDQLRWGAALLGAADPGQMAQDQAEAGRTPFSDALLAVLERGDGSRQRALTLADLHDLTWTRICQTQPSEDDRPRLFLESPDQSDGDIARGVALFPNVASAGGLTPAIDRRPPPQRRQEVPQEQPPLTHMPRPEPIQAPEERETLAGPPVRTREQIEQLPKASDQRPVRNVELEAEITHLKQQLGEQRQIAGERARRIEELVGEIAPLKKQLEDTRLTAEKHARKIGELETQIERLHAQHASAPHPDSQDRPAGAGPDDLTSSESAGRHKPGSSWRRWMMLAALGVTALAAIALWRLLSPV
jgi:hypothetical protein